MKIKILLALAIPFFIFACKKDSPVIEKPAIEKEDPLEYVRDSISYNIDGATYSLARFSSFYSAGYEDPYAKVDSIVKNAYYISGNKDSVLYSRKYGIYDDKAKVDVIFIKTYNKASILTEGIIVKPKNLIDLFTAGSRNYAIDFGRDNTQNGIAISISDGFKTFGSESFYKPPQLSPDAQKDSKFEITSLRKLKSGTYVLEAKFNATLFNEKNVSKKLQNGYLRLVLSKYDLIF